MVVEGDDITGMAWEGWRDRRRSVVGEGILKTVMVVWDCWRSGARLGKGKGTGFLLGLRESVAGYISDSVHGIIDICLNFYFIYIRRRNEVDINVKRTKRLRDDLARSSCAWNYNTPTIILM